MKMGPFKESDVLAAFEQVKVKYKFPFDLKKEQLQAVLHLTHGNHVLGVLPTGFGKSEIFILLPLILDVLKPSTSHASLVVVPLISLMQDLVERYSARGVSITAIQEANLADLKGGRYSVLLVTPEFLENAMSFREILESESFLCGLCCFTIDEAHVLIQWGDVFRPAYQVLGELRSIFDKTPVLLLTATCSPALKSSMLRTMHVTDSDVKTIAVVPDRPNITLTVVLKHPPEFEDTFEWYLKELEEKGMQCRKAIIYCRSLRHTGRGFGMLLYKAQKSAFSGDMTRSNKMIAEFHAEVEEDTKSSILKEFKKPDSTIRCLITTVAFGLGIDIPDIRLVCHWGQSDCISQYWQEVGRAGRDGKQSEAILYHRAIQLRLCQPDMKAFMNEVHEAKCIRHSLLRHLLIDGMPEIPKQDGQCTCKCCDNCRPLCVVCNSMVTNMQEATL